MIKYGSFAELNFTRKSQESKSVGISLVYNLLIKIRDTNKRTNLGKIYFENVYIKTISNIKAKTTSFIKKKGTNCGIYFFFTALMNKKIIIFLTIFFSIYLNIYYKYERGITKT